MDEIILSPFGDLEKKNKPVGCSAIGVNKNERVSYDSYYHFSTELC